MVRFRVKMATFFLQICMIFFSCLGIICMNALIVKTSVHLNTVCLNINRLSTFYQDIIGIHVKFYAGIFSACIIQYDMNQITCCFI